MKTKLLSVDYLGFTAMDKRYSSAMMPWVLLEIRRRGTREKLCLGIECGSLQAYDVNFELQFSHKLQNIARFTQVQSNPTEFLYLVKDSRDNLLYCYLFQASSVEEVTELFGHMKELAPHGGSAQSLNKGSNENFSRRQNSAIPGNAIQRQTSISTNKGFQLNLIESPASSAEGLNKIGTQSNMSMSRSYSTGLNRSGSSIATDSATNSFPLVRSASNAANLTSLCVDISPSNSHFFEVLYIGKIKVSHKKVPETLIDDALGKFKQYEIEKLKLAQMRRNSLLSAQADCMHAEDETTAKSTSNHNTKKVEFAPLPLPHKKMTKEESIDYKQDGLMSPSLTPLEANKHFFSDDESDSSPDKSSEKEFDDFSSARNNKVENSITTPKPIILSKKSFPVALEPNVLILNNLPNDNHNLSTLTEDDSEFSPKHQVNKSSISNEVNKNVEQTRHLFRGKSLTESQESIDSNCNDENMMNNNFKNKIIPENKLFTRDRSASIGTLNLHKTPIAQLIGDQNRTMLFQVGRTDLRLISPDRKQVLLHKQLRDVASCVKGVYNKEHFGFICREQDVECFVGYVFKCQSDSVSSDVVAAISQAFIAHAEILRQGKEKSPLLTCEHCPMVWYHKLCQDLEGLHEKRIYSAIIRRIDQLVEDEQVQIMTKYQGGAEDLVEIGERNAFLMMLLRAHCEAKQQRHVHDTAENRSEFLNQYLGGSTIFMKAKRSLSSSFDHLLKRKASKDDIGATLKDHFKKETSPVSTKETLDIPQDGNENMKLSTASNARDISLNLNQNNRDYELSPSPQLKSPMMDIFMKLGNNPSAKGYTKSEHNSKKSDESSNAEESSGEQSNNQGSWRQAIFNRVMQTGTLVEEFEKDRESGISSPVATTGELLRRPASYSNLNQIQSRKRTKEEIRELWKKGINQAILLIRMEKENARLRARQEVSAVKRIKLEYEDIGGGGNENSKVWDLLTGPRDSRLSTKVDSQMLLQAIKNGVPRAKRGEVWYFLAEQFCLRQPPPDTKNTPNYSVPYDSLLKQLTSHQHAILIDLGRTFPNHTYFSSPLGPGQLALFNLLKAYSLLDPEVGYCQGLSFVAGVLLLHLEEAEAFLMLRHLMFRRGLRKQYLPDMIALQIQLYQLSRLLKDHIPELYEKFDQHDVSPTLYAAPWILTIFTSQFPLGFVTRVFDLLFLESSEVIFRVAIALLEIHKDAIMMCDSFEEIMDYLKHKMPNIDKPMLDKVIKLTFSLDFGRQLNEYLVEYHVLQEEMAAIAPKMEELNKLESENKQLGKQNHQLMEQLESTNFKLSNMQQSQTRLENQVKTLEQTVATLARFIGTTYDKKKDVELPNDIRKLCQQVQQSDRKMLGVLGQKFGQSFTSKFSSTDFTANGHNNSHSEESSSDPDEKSVDKKQSHILKTGLSTPNLFNKDPTKPQQKIVDPLIDAQNLEKKRQYLSMKKSMSCNAGLMTNVNELNKKQETVNSPVVKIPPTLKGFPLRVLDETSEYNDADKPKMNANITPPIINCSGENKKTSKFFAHSHEQIRQEKLQAEQLKRDFDENLRKLDARLSPQGSTCDIGKLCNDNVIKDMSSDCDMNDIKLNLNSQSLSGDSGLGTPISPPNDKITSHNSFLSIEHNNKKVEPEIVNHPLIGCDVDIKFDVHSSKLKSLRPPKLGNSVSAKQ